MKKANLLLLLLTITSLIFAIGCSSGGSSSNDVNKYEVVKTGKEGILVMDRQTSELFTYQKGNWASLGKSDKAKSCNFGKFTYISQKTSNRHLVLDQKIGEVLAYKEGKWQSLGAPVNASACSDSHSFTALSKDGSGIILFDQVSGDVFRFQKDKWVKVSNPAKGATSATKNAGKLKPSKKSNNKPSTKIDEEEEEETIEVEDDQNNEAEEIDTEDEDFDFDSE